MKPTSVIVHVSAVTPPLRPRRGATAAAEEGGATATPRPVVARIVLLNIARTHMELLLLAKLDAIFDVFDDEQETINSFFPERAVRRFDILEFVENQSETAKLQRNSQSSPQDNLVIGIESTVERSNSLSRAADARHAGP